jgi:cyclopropane-fatty-acyl-phospholipid synthase
MNSTIVFGTVKHARVTPVHDELGYALWRYVLDVDELGQLDKELPLFGYNRFAPVSIYDRDYLDRRPGSIREKVVRLLRENGIAGPADHILMVTDAAFFRYVFNPVSFYYVFAAGGACIAILVEVNNVVGDRHLYLVPGDAGSSETGFLVATGIGKAFHVSPFNAVEGHYEMRFADLRERLDVHIDLHTAKGLVMTACLREEKRVPLTRQSLSHALWHPLLNTWRTMPRILRHAARLLLVKRLTFHTRPVVVSPMTIRIRAASRIQRFCQRQIEAALSRIRIGCLVFTTPEGSQTFGDPEAAFRARITVRDWAFFARVATDGDIGFGDAYMEGLWDSPDVTAVIRLMIDNVPHLQDRRLAPTLLHASLSRLAHLTRGNSLPGSKRNIRAHYDLSNAFFQTFLDSSMMYSCGLYLDPSESLEQAQLNKLDAVIGKARLGPADHVLEIGCGWGHFAIRAAQTCGCRVTGLTLSQEQYALARERVNAAGLEGQVEILLQDYRTLVGTFDKIVSIEMLEAVGHRHLPTFFRRCDALLKPDGLAVLQVITIPDQRYEVYRKDCDWIRKHIFPGGHLPSLTALCAAMTRDSSFIVEDLDNIGVHYARTLADWKRRFTDHPENRAELDRRAEFHRKWLYYLCYCQAAFESRTLENLQLVLTRPGNRALPPAPYGDAGA